MKMQKLSPSFKASPDRRALEEFLSKAKIGEQVSYSDLSEFLGRNIREPKNRALLYGALKAIKKIGVVFGTVRGFGIKRLEDSEISKLGQSRINQMHRTAKKARVEIQCINDFDSLTPEQKSQHQLTQQQILALELASSRQATKKIDERLKSEKKAVSPSVILKLLGSS